MSKRIGKIPMSMRMRRVDVQVFLMTVCVVVFSSLLNFAFDYNVTYHDMLVSLSDRVDSIYEYLDGELCPDSFTEINSKDDMEKDCYLDMKELFKDVKVSTGVQYLYTAKRAADGTLVYVIDGLDKSAPDFRNPGDTIEEEITADLDRALSGERVLPKDIKHTVWGDIFITYLPINDKNGQVIGVIGIEFAAEHQYRTYLLLRRATPVIILFTCLISGLLAMLLFRRISNPHYQDMANTDSLTGLKNRNAYELDTRNLLAQSLAAGTGLILLDLNRLKMVNDTLGHEAGDVYIKAMAKAMCNAVAGDEILYRVGGDEFVVMLKNCSVKELDEYLQRLAHAFEANRGELEDYASYAAGWAVCPDNRTGVFDATYDEADQRMYEAKKQHYTQV